MRARGARGPEAWLETGPARPLADDRHCRPAAPRHPLSAGGPFKGPKHGGGETAAAHPHPTPFTPQHTAVRCRLQALYCKETGIRISGAWRGVAGRGGAWRQAKSPSLPTLRGHYLGTDPSPLRQLARPRTRQSAPESTRLSRGCCCCCSGHKAAMSGSGSGVTRERLNVFVITRHAVKTSPRNPGLAGLFQGCRMSMVKRPHEFAKLPIYAFDSKEPFSSCGANLLSAVQRAHTATCLRPWALGPWSPWA